MTHALTPAVLPPEAGAHARPVRGRRAGAILVPRLVADAGPDAAERFLEFFTARIANPNTRAAYAVAATRFLAWCEDRDLGLRDISPMHVSIYVRTHPGKPATIKQNLSAVRMLCAWLVKTRILAADPSEIVRGPKHVRVEGLTPVLSREHARQLLASIDTDTVGGKRDKGLLSVLLYSFSRISAALGMHRDDFRMRGSQAWLRLDEKGGKRLQVPAHHRATEALDAYIAAGDVLNPHAPLFQSIRARSDRLTGQPLTRRNALQMIKRRALAAGVPADTCCHTFRATGITAYLLNGGALEHAQRIAGHASPTTTKLYDRTPDEVTVTEIERIVI